MIGITLKNFQEKAVDFLYEMTIIPKSEKKIVIQSPTGSGKTIILISYIEKFLDFIDDTVFVWISPGKGELEEQSKDKMEMFSPTLKTGNVEDILNQGFNANTTYFINWEKITKSGNLAISESEKLNLFEQIKVANRKGLKFILIIDEEHQHNTAKADSIIKALSADYEIRVSATPVNRAMGLFYEIDEVDVIDEELITKAMFVNHELEVEKLSDIYTETDILLEKADEVRKRILKAYVEEDDDVKPLVLIQFPNLNDDLITRVEEKLNSMGYTYENGLLSSWFSAENNADKEKKSKKLGKINIGTDDKTSITRNNSNQAFLLFKQALSTGWDCPRAKILVKLRENMSDTFEIQTLGRLRRMPKARHYGQDILDCSFLYTFDEKYKQAAISVGAFETQRVFLKDDPKKIVLLKELKNKDASFIDERKTRNQTYEFFKEKYNLNATKKENKRLLENNGFLFGDTIISIFLSGKFVRLKEFEDERNFMKIEHEYLVNTHLHGIELQHNIDSFKKFLGLSYSRTRAVFENLFRKDLGNDKYKLLDLNLQEFYAFVINNAEQIREDLREFDGIKASQMVLRVHKTVDFKIPLEENYPFITATKNPRIYDSNVYEEYNSSMTTSYHRSTSERLFEKYCENSNKVKYLYKNGDKGQDYLSIVYRKNNGVELNFYPDYIVVLVNGDIWIIETKGGEKSGESKNIDSQAENKFNQFKRFCHNHDYNFAFVRDIDEELFYSNTEYTDDMSGDNWGKIENLF